MKDATDRMFFVPIAAIRPWLIEKCVLVTLALDLWIVRLDEAYRYYEGGLNMAHFSWLDWLLPAPGSGVYLGVLFSTGVLALTIALGNLGTRWKLLLTALYSLSWAMSRLDSFQHHYLLSWLLLVIAFFPRVTLRELIDSTDNPSDGEKPPALVYAWAWALLMVLVAIVYFYTTVAKLDSVWQSGACLAQLQGMQDVLGPLQSIFGGDRLWPKLARLTVFVELIVALCYLIAPQIDSTPSTWVRRLGWVGWILAVGLHAGFEVVGLRIGWFSYFMILLATVSFLPAGLLQQVLTPVLSWIVARESSLIERFQAHGPLKMSFWVVLTVAVATTLSVGWLADLPGMGLTSIVIASALLVAGTVNAWRGIELKDLLYPTAALLSVLLLGLFISLGPTRAKYYSYCLSQHFRQCKYDEVESLLPGAEAYAAADDVHSQFYLSEVFATGPTPDLRNAQKALRHATKVCELVNYKNASALEILACAHATNNDFGEALKYVREAKKLLSDHQTSSGYAKLLELEELFGADEPYVAKCEYRYHTGDTE